MKWLLLANELRSQTGQKAGPCAWEKKITKKKKLKSSAIRRANAKTVEQYCNSVQCGSTNFSRADSRWWAVPAPFGTFPPRKRGAGSWEHPSVPPPDSPSFRANSLALGPSLLLSSSPAAPKLVTIRVRPNIYICESLPCDSNHRAQRDSLNPNLGTAQSYSYWTQPKPPLLKTRVWFSPTLWHPFLLSPLAI